MKVAVLFSGGKDSTFALQKAMEHEDVACLISLISKNDESYMFHTPNIEITKLQAMAIDIPIIEQQTSGQEGFELEDLKSALNKAIERYDIKGVVTGAIESVYQASRIQKICLDLKLWCFNPLWKKDQVKFLKELLDNDYEIIISGVFAYPFDESWLGRILDEQTLLELIDYKDKYQINPAGEGGEIETMVLNAPFFKKRLVVKGAEKQFSNHSGIYKVIDMHVEDK